MLLLGCVAEHMCEMIGLCVFVCVQSGTKANGSNRENRHGKLLAFEKYVCVCVLAVGSDLGDGSYEKHTLDITAEH